MSAAAASLRWARRLACGAVPLAAAFTAARSPPSCADEAPTPPSKLKLNKSIGSDCAAPHFRVYRGADGSAVSLDDVVAAFGAADVVLVGEAHDDPVAHQLELYLLIRAEQQSRRQVVLSLEQFERDAQTVLDEYLRGSVREQDMLMDARPWVNYAQDYRPMVEYARRCGLPVVAANVPRRYVGIAGSKGLGQLQALLAPSALALLPPLPVGEVSSDYRDHFSWAHGMAPEEAVLVGEAAEGTATAGGEQGEGGGGGGCPYIGLTAKQDTLLDPIILWDAGMADAIWQALGAGASAANRDAAPGAGGGQAEGGGRLIFHVCGSFHSEFGLGICEFLVRGFGLPRERVCVVTIYPHEQIDKFEPHRHSHAGDFVILTDAALPRSHAVRH